jgi:hypothetical protein
MAWFHRPSASLSQRWCYVALDLARHREITCVPQDRVKAIEQAINRTGLGQAFTEQPDCFGIRHAVRQPQSHEAHERQAIVDQVFRPLV